MTDDEAETIVADALALAQQRLRERPNFPIFQSIVNQLEYLRGAIRQKPRDLPKLRTIMIGHYGAREFEESDPLFSKKLIDSQWIASRLGDGLRP